MISNSKERILAALEAVYVSDESVAVAEQEWTVEGQDRFSIVEIVQRVLYGTLHLSGSYSPPVQHHPGFGQRLARACDNASSWLPGWTANPSDEPGWLRVSKPGWPVLRVPCWKYQDARLLTPSCWPHLFPGFVAFSGALGISDDEDDVVRVYFPLEAAGVEALISSLTASLNCRGIPFRLKVANHPDLYARPDSAVLFLRATDLPGAWPCLGAMSKVLAASLRPTGPVLCRSTRCGFFLARDPGGRESFGEARCRVLAEALVRFRIDRDDTHSEFAGFLAEFLKAREVDIDRPYAPLSDVEAFDSLVEALEGAPA